LVLVGGGRGSGRPLTGGAPVLMLDATGYDERFQVAQAELLPDGTVILALSRDDERLLYRLSTDGALSFLTVGDAPAKDPAGGRFYFHQDGAVMVWDMDAERAWRWAEGADAVSLDPAGRRVSLIDPGGAADWMASAANPELRRRVTYPLDGSPFQDRQAVWDDSGQLYALRRSEAGDAIVCYRLTSAAPEAEDAGFIWAEALFSGDAEAAGRVFPGGVNAAAWDGVQRVGYTGMTYRLGQIGQHMHLKWQLQDKDGYGLRAENVYLEKHDGAWRILEFSGSDDTVYRAEGGVLYAQDASGREALGPAPADGEMFIYDQPLQAYLYLRRTPQGFSLEVSYTGRRQALKAYPAELPDDARPEWLGVSKNGEVLAIQFTSGDPPARSLRIFNLTDEYWLPTPFLDHIDRACWLADDLILRASNDFTSFRWRYQPAEGLLGLD
jgi:hypothetical protein